MGMSDLFVTSSFTTSCVWRGEQEGMMSDFLVQIGHECPAEELLAVLKQPYGSRAPEGRCFTFPWGSIAVLSEHHADGRNVREYGDAVFSWVGDLVTDMSPEYVNALLGRIMDRRPCDTQAPRSLESDDVFEKLNGAFAILVACSDGLAIVTDPLAFTQVYVAYDSREEIASIGTHLDGVAWATTQSFPLDVTSCAEFLTWGNPSFPYTTYQQVEELGPGRLYWMNADPSELTLTDVPYWLPPAEIRSGYDEKAAAEELSRLLLSIVQDRCDRKRVGVTLSGGQDSRLIMACVPEDVECLGVTFAEYPNRETRTAQKVAEVYGRRFVFLQRQREFLADNVVRTVKLTGCEFDWLHAHAVGFADRIDALNLGVLLGGTGMDVYLKACEATDWICRKRMKGLLPDVYERAEGEHANDRAEAFEAVIGENVAEAMAARRKTHYEENVDIERGSLAEWLKVYPFSSDNVGSCWSAERRILPVRSVAMDRRLLDFALRCPIESRLGAKVFLRAAKRIYGPGARIPSANDGVRPCSGHLWRLVQRAIRKSHDRFTGVMERLGQKSPIQHSWHDYPAYWRESKQLDDLRREYGPHLDDLDGVLFKDSGRALLNDKDLFWEHGFRLLQLAVWLGVRKTYGRDINGSSAQLVSRRRKSSGRPPWYGSLN